MTARMNLSSTSSSVIVANGLTMAGVGGTGAGTINLTGQSSMLYAEGTETLNNATLNIGNNSTDYIYNYDLSAPAVLTLGSNSDDRSDWVVRLPHRLRGPRRQRHCQ